MRSMMSMDQTHCDIVFRPRTRTLNTRKKCLRYFQVRSSQRVTSGNRTSAKLYPNRGLKRRISTSDGPRCIFILLFTSKDRHGLTESRSRNTSCPNTPRRSHSPPTHPTCARNTRCRKPSNPRLHLTPPCRVVNGLPVLPHTHWNSHRRTT